MTANLTPQYHDAEERFKGATDHAEKLAALREMIALLPKHKGTEKMLRPPQQAALEARGGGRARAARRARARLELGHVKREGAGQWVLLGPPNAGKSSLLAALTHAHPEVGDYPFTTRVPLPGMMAFEDVQVQLVDTPAVAEGHTEPWLPNLAHDADGVLLVLDVAADDAEDVRAAPSRAARARARLAARAARSPPTRRRSSRKPVLVLGNKADATTARLRLCAQEAIGADLPFFAVSALTGAGLEPLREVLFRELERSASTPKEPGKKPDPRQPVRPARRSDDPRPREPRPQGDRRAA